MRGLKLIQDNNWSPLVVASFTDAWIETLMTFYLTNWQSRIFYRCVDWNMYEKYNIKLQKVASFTDAWIETGEPLKWDTTLSRIFYRCVDWNFKEDTQVYDYLCRIFYRCVDWNLERRVQSTNFNVASFTDAWIETYYMPALMATW